MSWCYRCADIRCKIVIDFNKDHNAEYETLWDILKASTTLRFDVQAKLWNNVADYMTSYTKRKLDDAKRMSC